MEQIAFKTLEGQATEHLGLFDPSLLEDPEVRSRIQVWHDALASGEYKQGNRWLHTSDGGHCPLGVADLVCHLKSETLKILDLDGCVKMGLISASGRISAGASIGSLNDHCDWSFADIANLISDQMRVLGYPLEVKP